MSKKKKPSKKSIYGLNDPNAQNVKSVVPDEYYSANMTRDEDANPRATNNSGYHHVSDDDLDEFDTSKDDLINEDIDQQSMSGDARFTDLGGTVDRDHVIDEDTDGPEAGTPGHWGIDEDTA